MQDTDNEWVGVSASFETRIKAGVSSNLGRETGYPASGVFVALLSISR
jgi:hypothetical protein